MCAASACIIKKFLTKPHDEKKITNFSVDRLFKNRKYWKFPLEFTITWWESSQMMKNSSLFYKYLTRLVDYFFPMPIAIELMMSNMHTRIFFQFVFPQLLFFFVSLILNCKKFSSSSWERKKLFNFSYSNISLIFSSRTLNSRAKCEDDFFVSFERRKIFCLVSTRQFARIHSTFSSSIHTIRGYFFLILKVRHTHTSY